MIGNCCNARAVMLPLLLALVGMAGPARADEVAIVLDASGSMWGEVDGRDKIVVAREVLGEAVRQWPTETGPGLVAYGHRRKGDCTDIETVVEPGALQPEAFIARVDAIQPRGKTPLTAAVLHAAELVKHDEQRASVVLVSDGIETCNRDPCEAAARLERTGVDFTAHVIGFDVERDADRAQLECLADNTGGEFLTAASAGTLRDALGRASQAAAATEPEPPPAPEVSVDAPAQATVGTELEVDWRPTVSREDYVTIVPADAAARRIDNHARAGDGSPSTLRAPRDPGDYEVRYVRNRGKAVLGSAPIELVDAEVTVRAPEEATVGTPIEVGFDRMIDEADYLTVVAADAADGRVGTHQRAGAGSPVRLRAPGEPGEYEVRYVLAEGQRVMGRAAVTVIDAEVAVQAPETVPAGGRIEIAWDTTVSEHDYITIVSAGAPEAAVGTHERAGAGSPVTLTAPGEPGNYEARYVLAEGHKLLGSAPVELTESRVRLSAPAKAQAGDEVKVAWQGTVNDSDYITIVPADAPDGDVGEHVRAGAGAGRSGRLRAPGKPGDYEVRYVLASGHRTLAREPVMLTGAEISIEAPDEVTAGTELAVSWQGTVHESDYITIVPADAPRGKVAGHIRAGVGSPARLRAPGKPGAYEVRYVLQAGHHDQASDPVRVTAPEVSISGPDSVVAGSELEVSWQGTVHESDYITIVPADAPRGKVAGHIRAGVGSPARLRAPGEPGAYEVRYVLQAGHHDQASDPVRVTAPEVSISGPDSVVAGSELEVSWQGTVHRSDYITIVPADAPDGTVAGHIRAGVGSPARLRAPREAGEYELRYVLEKGRRTQARASLRVEPGQ